MMLQDRLIATRDIALDGLLGIDHRDVLNDSWASQSTDGNGTVLAARLQTLMKTLQSGLISQSGGAVNYESLRVSPLLGEIRDLAARLKDIDPQTLEPGGERMTFWINLYNALVIHAVVTSRVTGSVASSSLGVLRFFRRAAYEIGGYRISCEDIEHGVLRGNRGNPYVPGPHFRSSDPRLKWVVHDVDPRIHCALNCASRSCPPVRVYDPALLDAQLELAARGFVEANVELDSSTGSLSVSRIFDWYSADFGGNAGVARFLLRYLPQDERRKWLHLRKDTVQFTYQPYDWGLNTPNMPHSLRFRDVTVERRTQYDEAT